MRGRRIWHALSRHCASPSLGSQASRLLRTRVSLTLVANPEIVASTLVPARRFNSEPMVVEQRNQQGILVKRVINHTFDAYPKLNVKIQEHYDSIFGKPKKHARTGEAEAPKTPLPFGFGAFRKHRIPDANG